VTGLLYPILFSVAIVVGMWVTEKGSSDPETTRRTYLFGVAGGVFGARAWFGLQYGEFFSGGGFSFFGFFIGAAFAAFGYHWWRFRSIRPSDFLDSAAPAIALGA
jgi:prolipoprotein diacylglyceryltransferase